MSNSSHSTSATRIWSLRLTFWATTTFQQQRSGVSLLPSLSSFPATPRPVPPSPASPIYSRAVAITRGYACLPDAATATSAAAGAELRSLCHPASAIAGRIWEVQHAGNRSGSRQSCVCVLVLNYPLRYSRIRVFRVIFVGRSRASVRVREREGVCVGHVIIQHEYGRHHRHPKETSRGRDVGAKQRNACTLCCMECIKRRTERDSYAFWICLLARASFRDSLSTAMTLSRSLRSGCTAVTPM